jgi:hypothetical protein
LSHDDTQHITGPAGLNVNNEVTSIPQPERRSSPIPFRSLTRDLPRVRRRRDGAQAQSTNLWVVRSSGRVSGRAQTDISKRKVVGTSVSVHGTGKDVQKARAPSAHIPTMLDSSLDPFFTLPDNLSLTPTQKAYVHLYFKELSPTVFGTTERALYCPRYTVGYHTARVSPAGIMWLIVVAMQCANNQRGTVPDRAIQTQIQSAFAHLHTAIQNARQNPVGVYVALMYANLAEVIMGTHRLQGLYTTAIESVIEAAGGFRAFQSTSPLPGVYLAAVYTFLSHRPRSLKEMETFKLRWIGRMGDIQRRFLELWHIHRTAQAQSKPPSSPLPSGEGGREITPDQSPDYQLDDAWSFSPADTEIMPLVRAMIIPRSGTGYMPRTTAIYLMHELIWALADFGGQPEHMKKYHRRLNFLVRHSLVNGGQVAATSYMAGGMAALIVARARQETFEDMFGAEDEEVKLERTQTSIDSLKMFAALRESGQDTLLETFRSWILDLADVSKPLRTFSDETTAALGSEALENWFASANPDT